MNKQKLNEDESLKRSHSKWSNFKLSFCMILLTISSSLVWIILALLNYLDLKALVILSLVTLIVFITSIILIKKFRR